MVEGGKSKIKMLCDSVRLGLKQSDELIVKNYELGTNYKNGTFEILETANPLLFDKYNMRSELLIIESHNGPKPINYIQAMGMENVLRESANAEIKRMLDREKEEKLDRQLKRGRPKTKKQDIVEK